jgi:hypothetical protein
MSTEREKSESTLFAEEFGEILKGIDNRYVRNKKIRANRTEFLKEVRPGLFASQNVLRKRDRYYHCFCLTAHKDVVGPSVHSPFEVGGRFDHNFTIQRGMVALVGHHLLLSDSHEKRIGWKGIAERCSLRAEESLLPHYLSIFDDAREALHHLARYIFENDISAPEDSRFVYNVIDCDMIRYAQSYKDSKEIERLLWNVLCTKREMFCAIKAKSAINFALFEAER